MADARALGGATALLESCSRRRNPRDPPPLVDPVREREGEREHHARRVTQRPAAGAFVPRSHYLALGLMPESHRALTMTIQLRREYGLQSLQTSPSMQHARASSRPKQQLYRMNLHMKTCVALIPPQEWTASPLVRVQHPHAEPSRPPASVPMPLHVPSSTAGMHSGETWCPWGTIERTWSRAPSSTLSVKRPFIGVCRLRELLSTVTAVSGVGQWVMLIEWLCPKR